MVDLANHTLELKGNEKEMDISTGLQNKKTQSNMMETMIPIVIGVLGTIPQRFNQGLEELKIRIQRETFETTALLRLVRIYRRVLETYGDLLSHTLQ